MSLPIHSPQVPPLPCTGVHACVSEWASPCRCSRSRGRHPARCTLHAAPRTLHPAPCRFSSSRRRRREALPRPSTISSARTRRSSTPSIASESLTVLRGGRRLCLCVRSARNHSRAVNDAVRTVQYTLHSPLRAGWCHGCSERAVHPGPTATARPARHRMNHDPCRTGCVVRSRSSV